MFTLPPRKIKCTEYNFSAVREHCYVFVEFELFVECEGQLNVGRRFEVLATDVSLHCVPYIRAGLHREETGAGLRPSLLAVCLFEQLGQNAFYLFGFRLA